MDEHVLSDVVSIESAVDAMIGELDISTGSREALAEISAGLHGSIDHSLLTTFQTIAAEKCNAAFGGVCNNVPDSAVASCVLGAMPDAAEAEFSPTTDAAADGEYDNDDLDLSDEIAKDVPATFRMKAECEHSSVSSADTVLTEKVHLLETKMDLALTHLQSLARIEALLVHVPVLNDPRMKTATLGDAHEMLVACYDRDAEAEHRTLMNAAKTHPLMKSAAASIVKGAAAAPIL